MASRNFPILFSASCFLSIDSKLGLVNLGLRLHIQVFHNPQRDRKLGFLNVALAGLLIFSQFMDEIENCDVGILAKTVSPNFS